MKYMAYKKITLDFFQIDGDWNVEIGHKLGNGGNCKCNFTVIKMFMFWHMISPDHKMSVTMGVNVQR